MNPLQLAVAGDGLHFEPQVLALNATLVQCQLPAGLSLEISQNLFFHVALGRGGEAGNGRYIDALFLRKLPDEPPRIQVIRPKIMSPFRQTMGLVENPAANFPLGDGAVKGTIAQLLR